MNISSERSLLVLVSPFAHESGHPYAFARAYLQALLQAGCDATVVTTFGFREQEREDTLLRHRLRRGFPFSEKLARQLHLFCRPLFVLLCTLRAAFLGAGSAKKSYSFIDGSPFLCAMLAMLQNRRVVYHFWEDFSSAYAEAPAACGLRSVWVRWRNSVFRRALDSRQLILVTDSPLLAEKSHARGIASHCVLYAISDDIAQRDPIQARRTLGLAPAATVLLLFGTHREDKDYETVFRALRLLPPQNVQLAIAGLTLSGPKPTELAARFPDVPVVIREGLVAPADVPDWFAAADLVLLPYKANRQAGSGLVYDALAYERPVAVTANGFLGDFVAQHHTGYPYPDGDANALADLLRRFQDESPAQHEEFRRHLRATRLQFSWSRRIHDYLALLTD